MSTSNILTAFLAGAAVGAVAGILFAPDKGSNTRKKIYSKTGDLADSVKSSFNSFIDGAKESYAGAKEEGEEFVDKAKSKYGSAKNEVKNALS
jgi:gas vesicle protein